MNFNLKAVFSYLEETVMELELLMSEDSVDEREDVRLDDCTLEELVESSQRHSSIGMILTKEKNFLKIFIWMEINWSKSCHFPAVPDDEILPLEMTEEREGEDWNKRGFVCRITDERDEEDSSVDENDATPGDEILISEEE